MEMFDRETKGGLCGRVREDLTLDLAAPALLFLKLLPVVLCAFNSGRLLVKRLV